jgi:hypothetical protein
MLDYLPACLLAICLPTYLLPTSYLPLTYLPTYLPTYTVGMESLPSRWK